MIEARIHKDVYGNEWEIRNCPLCIIGIPKFPIGDRLLPYVSKEIESVVHENGEISRTVLVPIETQIERWHRKYPEVGHVSTETQMNCTVLNAIPEIHDWDKQYLRIKKLKTTGTREEFLCFLDDLAQNLSEVTKIEPNVNGALMYGLVRTWQEGQRKTNVSVETLK